MEATGTQYINTGVKTANDITAKLKFVRTDNTFDVAGARNTVALGARTSATNRYFLIAVANINNAKHYCYGYAGTFASTGHGWTVNEVSEFTITVGANRLEIVKEGAGGWTYTTNISMYSGSIDIYLCAGNDNGSGYINPLRGFIYYCQITKAGALTRDFVPCYRKSDNKPGMYDTVTKQFFTNSGTGEFILGPET